MSEAAVLEAPAPALIPNPTPAKLVRPRDEAIAHLQNQLQRGTDIKGMRIRNAQELDQARTTKLEWTTQSTQLLNDLFDTPTVAEQCNDWVGRIYPEYAEFGNFVEQFYAEMDHRLNRLRAVLRGVEKLPASNRPATAAPLPPAPAVMAPPAPPAVNPAPAPAASAPGIINEPPRLMEAAAGLLVVRNCDENCRQAVAEFLESFGIDVSIAEQAQDMSDLLERHRGVQFAVLLAGDAQTEHQFAIGFCAGRLGLNRVILLNAHPGATGGSNGLTEITLDSSGGWQLQLARQLKRAGIAVDLNRLC